MTEQCNRCRYWLVDEKTLDANDEDFAFGRCRLAPPVIVQTIAARLMPLPEYGNQLDPEIDTTDVAVASHHPVTFATDWCGAFMRDPSASTPIQRAFAELQAAYGELHALPHDASDADAEPFHARIDAARDVIRGAAIEAPADVACKLRMALAGINQGGEATLQLYGLTDGDFEGDYFEDTVFDAVRQLERQA